MGRFLFLETPVFQIRGCHLARVTHRAKCGMCAKFGEDIWKNADFCQEHTNTQTCKQTLLYIYTDEKLLTI